MTHTFTPSLIRIIHTHGRGYRARHQPAQRERTGIQCYAQGDFVTWRSQDRTSILLFERFLYLVNHCLDWQTKSQWQGDWFSCSEWAAWVRVIPMWTHRFASNLLWGTEAVTPRFWAVGDWSWWWRWGNKHGAGDGGVLIKIDVFINRGLLYINSKTCSHTT